jgi:hypothetical protein
LTKEKPSGEAVARYIMAKGEALRVQSYLNRGRRFERLTESELSEKYVEAMREFASDPANRDRRQLSDDVDAEYGLRGLEPPTGLVTAEIDAIVNAGTTAYEEMTDERKAEIEAEMQDEYATAMKEQH